jgi:hypothetical protein
LGQQDYSNNDATARVLKFTLKEAMRVLETVILPEDKSEWPSVILQALFNQHPYLVFDDAKVVINDLQTERDKYDGMVTVLVAGRNFQIPFFIKNGKLYPMDFFFDTETKDVAVLTKENFFKAVLVGNRLGEVQEQQPQQPGVVEPRVNVREPNLDQFTQIDRLALLNDDYGKVKVGMVKPEGRMRRVIIYEV